MTYPISVNICTYNEQDNIGDCIRAIQKNKPAEILVIDGGSTDQTIEMAESLGAMVIRLNQKGLASQRQAGIEASGQEFIAIVDADDRLDENCLPALYRELVDLNLDAIQALNKPLEIRTYWQRAMASTLVVEEPLPRPSIMVGRPALYRAASLKAVGFDPFFNGAGAEDADLARAFQLRGFQQAIGTGVSYRKHETTLRDHRNKWKKYGRGDARFVFKYPERKSRIFRHLLITYPFLRPLQAIKRGEWQYVPFHMLTGLCRFMHFWPEYLKLRKKYTNYSRWRQHAYSMISTT